MLPDGKPEGFLAYRNGTTSPSVPIAANVKLVNYLRENHGYKIVQHGLHHDYLEFERVKDGAVGDWLEQGTKALLDAGFPRPGTFVAPDDKFSRDALQETARRFPVISSGWYERRRLPYTWWPRYSWKKLRAEPHWRIGRTLLLSHPGCLLSCFRPYEKMLETIRGEIEQRQLTVLVTHWWEYFRQQQADDAFIGVLHETAEYLARERDIRVISFSDLAANSIPLN
jgi:hypothetical protein